MSRVLFSFGTAFALTSLIAGCGMDDNEDIWMPPSSNGKADGVSIVHGPSIPSTYVSASKDYLTGRSISSLQSVGALTGDVLALAMRADGIIANLPANGRIEAAELVRMENPAIFATLFPNEQAALPMVWPMLEAPTTQTISVSVPGAVAAVTPQLTEPGGLTPPSSILITSLDASQQTVARRVQLVFNGDAAATTIQVADIESVIAMPQAFTPAEIVQLKAILELFHDRATSSEDATAVVPEPGLTTEHVAIGTLSLDYQSNVVLHETRGMYSQGNSIGWTGTLVLEHSLAAKLNAATTDAMILLELDNGSEFIYRGAVTELPSLPGGTYVLERYVSGARQATHSLGLPPIVPGTTSTDLSEYLDFTLVLANGTKLVKNAVSTTTSAYWSNAEFHHEKTQVTNPALNQNILASVATPTLTLPTGRYEVPTSGGTMLLDIYPQGVIRGTWGQTTRSLRFSTSGYEKAFAANLGGIGVNLAVPSHTLSAGNVRMTLTPVQRTK